MDGSETAQQDQTGGINVRVDHIETGGGPFVDFTSWNMHGKVVIGLKNRMVCK
jgi:hypothetical protein